VNEPTTQSDDGAAPAGDDEAARSHRFQVLALPHLDAAYNLARWLCRNRNDAEDIVQEAYLRAFRFFDSFHGESARPWLLAIVRRTWYSEWRRRASTEEVAAFDDNQDDVPLEGWASAGVDPETLAIQAQDAQRVHAALEQLPVEFREVLILRELEDLSYREIAAISDLPVGTVMSRLARGRRKLASLLGGIQRTAAAPSPEAAAQQERPAAGARWQPAAPANPTHCAQETPDGL
jgi:RNA polymerase sigma factor (sigma-70 family)